MKLLFVIHDYLPEHVGGCEVHTHQLATALAARGHEVTVVCTERDLSRSAGTWIERTHEGLRVIEMSHPREYGDVAESWRQEAAGEVFTELVRRERPELVHFQHLMYWGAACVGRAAAVGAGTVLTLHDAYLLCDRCTLWVGEKEKEGRCAPDRPERCNTCLERHPFRDPRWGPDPKQAHRRAMLERLAHHREHLAHLDAALAPSRTIAEIHGGAGLLREDQLDLFPNPTPGPVATPRPPRPPRTAGPLRAGFVGAPTPAKGVHVLVEAAGRLSGEIECHIFGPLEWFPDYAQRLHAAAGPNVHFHGRFDPADLDAVLARIDVLVLPSLWIENHPLVLSEAWRNGIPVIATGGGGSEEVVRDGENGLLVPPGDVDALTAALADLARDPGRAASLAAGRPPLVDLEDYSERVEQVYERCLSRVGG